MGCPRIEAGPIPPRAGNVSMDCSKLARALGYDPFDPWPHDEALVPTHHDWHRERPPGEQWLGGVFARGAVSQSAAAGTRNKESGVKLPLVLTQGRERRREEYAELRILAYFPFASLPLATLR